MSSNKHITSMKTSLRLLLAVCAITILTACGNNGAGTSADTAVTATTATSNVQLVQSVDAYRPPASTTAQEPPMKPRDLRVAPTATNIALGEPQDSQTAAARKNNEATAENHMGKPLQIGFGRDVVQTATASATQQVLQWQTTASGGQVTALNFSSTGARGIRIGLLITKLAETATLRFYAKGAATAFEVKGAEVLKVLAANLAAGDKTDAGRTYWGPFIDGSNGTIEIEIPAGMASTSVEVSVPNVTHLFMSTKESNTATSQLNYTGDTNAGLSCQVDVKCTTPLPAASDAVAHIIFNKNGSAFICSGTMLNDSLNSSTPYFLTANHCISDQTVASTLQTWFKYRALTCNDGTTGEYYPTNNTGATLLYTAYGTDSTLMKLAGTPSVAGVLYAGWDSTPPNLIGVHSVHHPKGDQQRLSRGTLTSYSTRSATNPNLFIGSNITSGTILDVTLTTGLTEGGSSGSGLFKGTDANPILIGQLFGGSLPACTVPNGPIATPANNVYGRFDVAYNAGMSDWLNQGIKSVTQFYNATSGVHYYAYGVTDSSAFSTSNPTYSNQGISFKVSSYQAAGMSPVYRFYNTNNGTYFYTISEKERAAVATNTPRMRFDGIVWYASATSTAGTVPLYSAFNKVTGSQFFTSSLTARTNFITANPQFITDGIAFYVTP
jgi:lysyl endopeptidase